MFRIVRRKVQRIPVVWIPSANRNIRVARVSHREFFTRNRDSDDGSSGKSNRLLSSEDVIFSRTE